MCSPRGILILNLAAKFDSECWLHYLLIMLKSTRRFNKSEGKWHFQSFSRAKIEYLPMEKLPKTSFSAVLRQKIRGKKMNYFLGTLISVL